MDAFLASPKSVLQTCIPSLFLYAERPYSLGITRQLKSVEEATTLIQKFMRRGGRVHSVNPQARDGAQSFPEQSVIMIDFKTLKAS